MSESREIGPIRVRASDAEREEIAARLRTAIGEGRLTLDEGDQRLAGVYATTYRDELSAFTADLPLAEPPPGELARPPRPHRSGWPGPVVPVGGLLVLAVLLTGLWGLAASGVLWPLVVFGVIAFTIGRRRRHRHWAGGGHPWGRRPPPARPG